ncbi:hypothetical protein A33M_0328 [Rhodovulum sp. PH10]|uniref:hypothetical protein n=1 Tax=Rhodovulum sp. PH10 TaxID=1187851 RepID=UPI00027C2178|nr:hypothetical protein [Rhodovulum sp. PH10]EJW13169.1 hypothetical protein A33M_0328 [Rhodovulum sp. PH10]
MTGLVSLLGASAAALTARKNGPSLYDLCDPLLRGAGPGDAHLRTFYKTAVANPALRPLLGRAGLPVLADRQTFAGLEAAIRSARDDAAPDWAAIGREVAPLIDAVPQHHPVRPPLAGTPPMPPPAEIEYVLRGCAKHLIDAHRRHGGFLPGYAAFNFAGDPDFHGRDLVTALTGLQARTYKNATLLFNLARAFVLPNQPIARLLNPPWSGFAEPMWEPVQIRHRCAYYDAFFAEALMDYLGSGLARPEETGPARQAISGMIDFCLKTSREEVKHPDDGTPFSVVTALVPPPDVRMSDFFWKLKQDLGFGTYVPDCDTTACSLSAATQFGVEDPMLEQPFVDFYAGYQVRDGSNRPPPSVDINAPELNFSGGIVTWIESAKGETPFGNDLDPTLNLDVLEAAFRNHARWGIVDTQRRRDFLRDVLRFHLRLVTSGVFTDPRAHIYYLPELYAAYVGRCLAAFRAMPAEVRRAVDPDGAFETIRKIVLDYVQDDLAAHEMNPFDAALALLALAKLGGERAAYAAPLDVLVKSFGEGGRKAPYKAYEWNKMKTPTRILVGGPEVTSAFVLSALVHARAALTGMNVSGRAA